MLPAADDPRIDNPATTATAPIRTKLIPDRFGEPSNPTRPKPQASPYLPESTKRRWMMLISVALVCLGLLGPYMISLERIGDSWQIQEIYWNAATILNTESIYATHVMVGLGMLLIASALCWGRGMRHAGWLRLAFGLSIPIMTTLGLAAVLDIGLHDWTSQTRPLLFVWTYLLAYPAAMVVFVMNVRFGTRRAWHAG